MIEPRDPAGRGAPPCPGPAAADALHPAFATRYSPVRFDPSHVVDQRQVDVLLDAARLAPSAGNAQPWAFAVGRRGDAVHRRLVPLLARSSGVWAPDASLLVVNLAHLEVGDTGLEYSEFARYDLGQAVAHLTLQAWSMGLASHQFRAFDREAVTIELGIEPGWEVTSMTAVGLAAHGAGEVRSAGTSRDRRSRSDVVIARDDTSHEIDKST